MGGGIAQTYAVAGYAVAVRDINDDAINATKHALFDGKWGIKRGVERGKLPFDEAVSAMQRVTFGRISRSSPTATSSSKPSPRSSNSSSRCSRNSTAW